MVGASVAVASLVSACGTGSDVTTVSMVPVPSAAPLPPPEPQAGPIDASPLLDAVTDTTASYALADVSSPDAPEGYGEVDAGHDAATVAAATLRDGASHTSMPTSTATPTAAGPVFVESSNIMATSNAMARIRSFANICYRNAVVADPDLEGKLTLDVRLTPSGQVESAEVEAVSGISNEMISCITHKVRLLNFDPAQHLKNLRVPMTFHKP
jgi:hypothetical protein